MVPKKSNIARLKSHIPPEYQQEVILDAVLNIQANIMTMAGILMNLESRSLNTPGQVTVDFYRQQFYTHAKVMKEMFSEFGEIETL